MPSRLRTYYVGPMQGAPDGGESWRKTLDKWCEEMGVSGQNPCTMERQIHHKSTVAVQRDLKNILASPDRTSYGAIIPPAKFRSTIDKIQNRDFKAVRDSNFIIAYLEHALGPGGTYAELQEALRLNIPVYAVCLKGIQNENSWMLNTIWRSGGEIFTSWEECLAYLKKQIEEGEI